MCNFINKKMCIHVFYGRLRRKRLSKHMEMKKRRFLHLKYGNSCVLFLVGFQMIFHTSSCGLIAPLLDLDSDCQIKCSRPFLNLY